MRRRRRHIRSWEHVTLPSERERVAAEAILEARRLERQAEIARGPRFQLIPGLFEEMHVREEDGQLLVAITKRGEATTPEEHAALGRCLAEYERAFKVVSHIQNTFR